MQIEHLKMMHEQMNPIHSQPDEDYQSSYVMARIMKDESSVGHEESHIKGAPFRMRYMQPSESMNQLQPVKDRDLNIKRTSAINSGTESKVYSQREAQDYKKRNPSPHPAKELRKETKQSKTKKSRHSSSSPSNHKPSYSSISSDEEAVQQSRPKSVRQKRQRSQSRDQKREKKGCSHQHQEPLKVQSASVTKR